MTLLKKACIEDCEHFSLVHDLFRSLNRLLTHTLHIFIFHSVLDEAEHGSTNETGMCK